MNTKIAIDKYPSKNFAVFNAEKPARSEDARLFDNEVLSSNFSWLLLNKSQLKLELKTFLSQCSVFRFRNDFESPILHITRRLQTRTIEPLLFEVKIEV
jgi:hypothetical protein